MASLSYIIRSTPQKSQPILSQSPAWMTCFWVLERRESETHVASRFSKRGFPRVSSGDLRIKFKAFESRPSHYHRLRQMPSGGPTPGEEVKPGGITVAPYRWSSVLTTLRSGRDQ